ncbi:MAG: NACHT domain-containing protein [Caldilinea sp. CFX5]|nr:NACHT domain-containing protein [Caldilinea sp. CFX5]
MVAAGAVAIWLAVHNRRPPPIAAPTTDKPETKAHRRGVAIGRDLDNSAIATGDRNIIGDNNSITYIRTVYLQAPGRAELDQAAFDQALERYLAWVSNRYGKLRLRGIERRELQVLDLTLDDVYVALAATINPARTEPSGRTSQRRGAEEVLGEAQRAVIDMNQLLTLGPRLMIVGGPGSGKTTYLHLIAATLATALRTGATQLGAEALGLADPLPLPIFVTLSDYNRYRKEAVGAGDARQGTLTAFISQSLIRQEAALGLPTDFFERLLMQGQSCILLLDGLDEVADERERWLVRQAVENVANNRGLRQIVVTCRTRAHRGDTVLPEEFRVAEVQPMTDTQVAALAARWCAAAYNTQDAAAETARLQAAIRHLEALRAARQEPPLVESPLLVTIVAIVHYNQRRLPDERAELYEKCVDVLLAEKHHPTSQSTFELADWGGTLTEKRNLLAYLAFQMMSAGAADRTVSEEQLRAWLRPPLARKHGEEKVESALATFIQAMRERGSLLDERGGRYRFLHLTFQEFLCAFYLVESLRESDKMVAFLTAESRLTQSWWRETVLLTVGYLGLRSQENALALVRGLATSVDQGEAALVAAEIAANALLELDSRDAETMAVVKPRLLQLFAPTLVAGGLLRGAAGAALGRLGDPRPGVGVKNSLPDLDWVTIGAGPFLMGSNRAQDNDAYDDEMPQFPYVLRQPFAISRYPITVAQYQTFVAAGGYAHAPYWQEATALNSWRDGQLRCRSWSIERQEYIEEWANQPATYGPRFAIANHPQVGVSWYEALAFCRWLSERTGQAIRLPTEVEWERAARHTDGHSYPWGNSGKAADHCNMNATRIGSTSAVGAFPHGNAVCGAADMAGNVWEWASSLWGIDGQKLTYGYPYDPADGREKLAAGADTRRVVRGGSFVNSQLNVRCAARGRLCPDNRLSDVGFRVVRAPGL